MSSPRPWGCFFRLTGRQEFLPVFPTPVGVFPPALYSSPLTLCLPHARGGVSPSPGAYLTKMGSSPRPWGCFSPFADYVVTQYVFPTPVGVFPPAARKHFGLFRLPHARGGVSPRPLRPPHPLRSSPRPWGCFRACLSLFRAAHVFPTPVGVFLAHPGMRLVFRGLPHARGGVSLLKAFVGLWILSSPRPWGCFQRPRGHPVVLVVFPTPVGVFPSLNPLRTLLAGLPHARGGVSVGRFLNSRRVGSHLMLC